MLYSNTYIITYMEKNMKIHIAQNRTKVSLPCSSIITMIYITNINNSIFIVKKYY